MQMPTFYSGSHGGSQRATEVEANQKYILTPQRRRGVLEKEHLPEREENPNEKGK